VQLFGEQVNTEISVLARLARRGDTNDLARASLKNQEITNADVVARDGNGVGMHLVGWGRVVGRWAS